MSAAPAALAGLTTKGGIAVGKDADLVAFAPDARSTVGELEHKNPVTPLRRARAHGGWCGGSGWAAASSTAARRAAGLLDRGGSARVAP